MSVYLPLSAQKQRARACLHGQGQTPPPANRITERIVDASPQAKVTCDSPVHSPWPMGSRRRVLALTASSITEGDFAWPTIPGMLPSHGTNHPVGEGGMGKNEGLASLAASG